MENCFSRAMIAVVMGAAFSNYILQNNLFLKLEKLMFCKK